MNDVSAEELQSLRKIRYEELQKIKEQLQEQDLKWQEVSTPFSPLLVCPAEGLSAACLQCPSKPGFGMCAAIYGADF